MDNKALLLVEIIYGGAIGATVAAIYKGKLYSVGRGDIVTLEDGRIGFVRELNYIFDFDNTYKIFELVCNVYTVRDLYRRYMGDDKDGNTTVL